MDGDFFRAVVASLGEGVLVVDSEGTVVHANPAADAIVGRALSGTSLRSLVGELLHADVLTPYAYAELPPVRAMVGEEHALADVVMRESRVRLSVTSRPLRHDDTRG